ncbi:MAG: VWA domain-containing protein [Bacteroidales bacterium]
MLHFATPYLLWLLLLIPAIVILYLSYRFWRKKRLAELGQPDVVRTIMTGTDTYRHRYKIILQLMVFGLMIIAAAQPHVAGKAQKRTIKGSDVVICLDVSNSMMAEDLKPNRLIRARQSLASLIRQFDREQVGLIVFAGEAYIQVPLTVDKSAAVMLLNNINAGDISYQGTAIADAISLAVRSFNPEAGKNAGRAIILVTDGEDHEGSVVEEAKLAAEQGIPIFTVGIGNPNGAPIPVYEDGILTGYRKDSQGNTIISSLNPKLLADIAEISGGQFFLSANLNSAMQRIRSEIDRMNQGERTVLLPDQYAHQYGWFAGLALLLLAIELLIPYRGSRKSILEKFSGYIR